MDNLIKKLAKLSSFEFSENEISTFEKDFSDIIPLIDKISDFPFFEDSSMQQENYNSLRTDTPKENEYNFKTNKVSRIIK